MMAKVNTVYISLTEEDHKAINTLIQFGLRRLTALIDMIGSPIEDEGIEVVEKYFDDLTTRKQPCEKANKTKKQPSTKDKTKDEQEKPDRKDKQFTKKTKQVKHTAPKEDRLLSMPEVLEKLRPYGITSQRIYHRMGTGKFPKSVKQGSRVFWRLSDIEHWESEQK